MLWILLQISFIAIGLLLGYGYHWWSSAFSDSSIGYRLMLARPSREFLEFVGLSLLFAVVWLLISNKRQVIKTLVALYLLGLLVAYNPPLQPLVWLMWHLGDGYVGALILIWITLGLEALIFLITLPKTWPWLRRQLPKLGQVPLLIWALWGGFVLWFWKPAIALDCRAYESDSVAPLAAQWKLKPQTLPGVEHLPVISFITRVESFPSRSYSCRKKQAYSFAGAFNEFSLQVSFRGKDALAYEATATVRDDGGLRFISAWQVKQNTAVKPLSTRGALTGRIETTLEKLYRAEPQLRQSTCVAFGPHWYGENTYIVADIAASGKPNELYLMRMSGEQARIERRWNTEAIQASLRRITQRLGIDLADWSMNATSPPLYSCLPGKPYFGLQILDDKYQAYLPPIQIKSSMLLNEAMVILAQGRRGVHQLHASEINSDYTAYIRKYFDFPPEPADIPWNHISVSGSTPFTLITKPRQVKIQKLKP